MKKIVLAMLLVAAVTAVAQTDPSAAQPQSAAQPGAPAQQKKEIKDPAEYNAYIGAVGQTDPAAKVSGFEAFLTQYPNSVMKEDAMELLMGAYQQTNNAAKTVETAQKVLQVNACNLRALALLAFTKRAMAEAGGAAAAQNLAEAGQYGEKGLQCVQTATKPEGTKDEDFQKLKAQVAGIFNGSAGMNAFQAKDYAKAQQFLRASVDADPTNLRDVYPLALAYMTPGPTVKMKEGLFFIARAGNLAPAGPGKDQISKFGKSKYAKFHNGEEGWNELVAATAATTLPTPEVLGKIVEFVPPTPAEQCADLLKTKKVEEMSFAEWQLCLSEGKPEDAEKVWSVLKGKPLQMQAHIISVDSASNLKLAGSSDDIEAKRADIDLTMTAAIPARQIPKADTDFQFEGTPVSYEAKPFVMTMKEGAMLVKAAPPAPKKPPVRRKPGAR